LVFEYLVGGDCGDHQLVLGFMDRYCTFQGNAGVSPATLAKLLQKLSMETGTVVCFVRQSLEMLNIFFWPLSTVIHGVFKGFKQLLEAQ